MADERPDLSGILNGLLSNPGALSSILGMLGNAQGEASRQAAEPAKEPTATEGAAALPVMAPPTVRKHPERYTLLHALSPYLSPGRRRALDGAVRILEVLELFENAK